MRYRSYLFDDDEGIRDIVKEILQKRGYEVLDFPSVTVCPLYLDGACSCPMDTACCEFIISDVNMPGMSGLEFIEHQRKSGCKVNFIALMSGAWTDEGRLLAEEMGCVTFTKPFRIEVLNKWLDHCERKLKAGKNHQQYQSRACA